MEQIAVARQLPTSTAATTRAAIANALLAADSPTMMGSIELQPHQLEACARLRNAMSIFGGALLCDPVGTGKTFTALAVARSYNDVLVVAPAVLRTMWNAAAEASGTTVSFLSWESLSRTRIKPASPAFIILDEAHHARNPGTRRFAALTALAASGDVLLLSATPVHNRRKDFLALLSIFLGERASSLSSGELGAIVVRRESVAARVFLRTPRVAPTQWYTLPADDRIPHAILALPPPLPVRDGGNGGALITHSLIRQWASSDAALRAGLNRRRLKASAMRASLESGIWPTASELASWTMAEGSVQLAFAGLISTAGGDVSHLVHSVDVHDSAICAILGMLPRQSGRDVATVEIIRALRAEHRQMRVVAFSQYEATVRFLFAHLARDGYVAALTGNGGRVAGGRITRSEAIARFAPLASGVLRPDRANDVTLLLTTDLLSEGVNLQDAAIVIHLDLPWTPARMEQRLGRVARFGSRHETVRTFAFRPPASAEMVARIEHILDIKSHEASSIRGEPMFVEELTTRLASWRRGASSSVYPSAATVEGNVRGFIAACIVNERAVMIGSTGQRVSDDPAILAECARLAEGPDTVTDSTALDAAFQSITTHFAVTHALDGVSHSSVAAPVRQRMFTNLSRAVGSSRLHKRHQMVALARIARDEISGRMGRFRETQLSQLFSSGDTSSNLLATLQNPARPVPTPLRKPGTVEVVAIILFADVTLLNPPP